VCLGSTGRWPVVAGSLPATLNGTCSRKYPESSRQAAEMNRLAACAPQQTGAPCHGGQAQDRALPVCERAPVPVTSSSDES